MTKKDAAKIIALLAAIYPQYYKNMRREEIETAVELWTEILSGESFLDVTEAVKRFIGLDIKGFPPSIGAIKAEIHNPHIERDLKAEFEKYKRPWKDTEEIDADD